MSRLVSTLILLTTLNYPISSQSTIDCNFNIVLDSQTDVDNFHSDYQHCDTFRGIWIKSRSSQAPIVSLDALLEREIVVGSLLLDNLPALATLDGLDSFIVEGSLRIYDLPNLVDVSGVTHNTYLDGTLSFRFNEYITDLSDFKEFRNINTLFTLGVGKIEGIYINDNTIRIGIAENENFDLEWFITNNQIKQFSLLQMVYNKGFDLKDLKDIELGFLEIDGCSNFTLNGLQYMSEIGDLFIENSHIDSLSRYSFKELNSVEHLVVDNVAPLRDLYELIPNIQEIEHSIELSNNPHLLNIDVLDQVPLPLQAQFYEPDVEPNEVYIFNNNKLNPCNSEFVCRANEIYPEKIFLQDNATDCYQSGFCTGSELFHETNASWTYGVQDQIEGEVEYVTYDMSDTIHRERKIGVKLESTDSEKHLTVAREGDRFYVWSDALNSFQLHYDFAATDHYETKFYNPFNGATENVTIYVDSVEQRMIDGQSVRVQHLRSGFGRRGLPEIQFEAADRIGSLDYGLRLPMHPGLNNTDSILAAFRQNENQLRCYSDNSRSIRFVEFPCDSTWSSTTSIKDKATPLLKVYPNPVQDVLNISNGLSFNLEVYDSQGRKVLFKTALPEYETIDLGDWSPGLYLLRFVSHREVVTRKIMVGG